MLGGTQEKIFSLTGDGEKQKKIELVARRDEAQGQPKIVLKAHTHDDLVRIEAEAREAGKKLTNSPIKKIICTGNTTLYQKNFKFFLEGAGSSS